MASMQCHKPANHEACPQNCHKKPAAKGGSLGQKVSEIASFPKGGHSSSTTSTQATPATNGQHGLNQHHATTGVTCHGTKKRGELKNKKTGGSRNLLQKIKDGISGHSSESSSSSSSDSENEGCRNKASDLSVYQ